jgi:hypothetical protein
MEIGLEHDFMPLNRFLAPKEGLDDERIQWFRSFAKHCWEAQSEETVRDYNQAAGGPLEVKVTRGKKGWSDGVWIFYGSKQVSILIAAST